MKTYFVIVFKTLSCGVEYSCVSNYYFKSEKDARAYAREFIEKSCIFSAFDIKDVMPFIA